MQILTFERDLKHSNVNSNLSKGIRRIRILILTIRKGFETFKYKFEPFEKDSNHSKQIRTIRKGFEAFECKLEQFEMDLKDSNANSNYSKGI